MPKGRYSARGDLEELQRRVWSFLTKIQASLGRRERNIEEIARLGTVFIQAVNAYTRALEISDSDRLKALEEWREELEGRGQTVQPGTVANQHDTSRAASA